MTTVSQMPSIAKPSLADRLRSKETRRSLLMWLILSPLVFMVIVPLIFTTAMAFTLESNQLNYPIEWIPQPATLANFTRIFADTTLPIIRWFVNSLIVSTIGTTAIVFLSTLSGYAFARLDFPFKNLLFSLLIFSLMIPGAITLIPVFLLLRDFELLNTYQSIWLPASASVLGIFLMRQHFYDIPQDIEDAARMDGASRFRIYWQVCLPMVQSSVVAIGIFSFLALWNDLFWPLIVLSDREMLTLPIGLVVLQQGSYIQRGLAFAGAFIAAAPALAFYAIFQRKIIAGITMTGMAGQ
jgi:multiple sugar transport system permease protein